jgi:hypothetical protein
VENKFLLVECICGGTSCITKAEIDSMPDQRFLYCKNIVGKGEKQRICGNPILALVLKNNFWRGTYRIDID